MYHSQDISQCVCQYFKVKKKSLKETFLVLKVSLSPSLSVSKVSIVNIHHLIHLVCINVYDENTKKLFHTKFKYTTQYYLQPSLLYDH